MREFDSWATTECDMCATEFQVTRTEARSYPDTDGTVLCGDCWEYQRGVADSEKRIAELEGSLEEWKLDFNALKAENERLKARAPITILQAKAAINLWESEYVGQNSARLWDWAVEQARNPFRETPKEGSSDE